MTCEICILAGGLSRRMGRDKAGLRLGRRTMLERIRAEARATGLPVRVIRRDALPRCGPLGGVYTALRNTRAEAVLFLACDMPLVTAVLMQHLVSNSGARNHGVFVRFKGIVGFPFLLPGSVLPLVALQIERGHLSLQRLAKALGAKAIRLPRHFASRLRNLNTPAEWRQAQRSWKESSHIRSDKHLK